MIFVFVKHANKKCIIDTTCHFKIASLLHIVFTDSAQCSIVRNCCLCRSIKDTAIQCKLLYVLPVSMMHNIYEKLVLECK